MTVEATPRHLLLPRSPSNRRSAEGRLLKLSPRKRSGVETVSFFFVALRRGLKLRLLGRGEHGLHEPEAAVLDLLDRRRLLRLELLVARLQLLHLGLEVRLGVLDL